ncbi:TIM barrel protein [Aliifodinibius sp. S!AR15-10]|uniref:hydroxypyruvate isomerase family protein n=1 Tax=Aliifodinibius sp. S!AR15-10 TaxID=2950437 RepID=UPI00285F4458|nr:TIM barrel protein [Aliifodinibius sp. S!AR15-10]MDR8392552.1 TIM barrel protein [Aliifodinibius sp. S!AR15-10]
MDRKNFLKNSLLAGSAFAAAPLNIHASGKSFSKGNTQHSFKLKYAPHLGMFRNHAGNDPIDQIKFMADQGFTAFEDNGLMRRTPEMQEKMGSQLANLGMEMGVFVIDKGGNSANSFTAGNPEYTEIFVNACKEAVEVAKRVNATWMTVVPGNFDRSLPMGIQTSNVIETLRRGAEIFEPHGLVMVLEPLSDTPDLYLRYSDQTYEICKAVNSPSCKILYDVYHMQKNEGNLIRNMELCWDEIAYLQVGDVPGRNEPGTGEINFQNVFKYVHEKGFDGIVGMEHGNAGDGEEGEKALIEAYVEADSFS